MIPVLTIASSDSCGGAGIQADLRAFNALGLHGMSVVVTVTSQNTQQVISIHSLPSDNIESQLKAVFDDSPPFAVKTGMLYSAKNAKLVSQFLKGKDIPIVVDPVLSATTGTNLYAEGYVNAIREFAGQATVLMPNIPETRILTGMKITTEYDVRKAAVKLIGLGCAYVLVKGGHLSSKDAIDILYDGKSFKKFYSPKVKVKLHGAGCTYSSLVAGYLAKGADVPDAVKMAKNIIESAIRNSISMGKGGLNVPVFIKVPILIKRGKSKDETDSVRKNLSIAVSKLQTIEFPLILMPRVGINIVYALPDAEFLDDVYAVPGRLWLTKGRLKSSAMSVESGASKHVATIALTAHRYDVKVLSVMNVKYSAAALDACRMAGLKTGTFSRINEPPAVSTMEWGTDYVFRRLSGGTPDIIYDKGSKDKEAMIRILGKTPSDVVTKLTKIIKCMTSN